MKLVTKELERLFEKHPVMSGDGDELRTRPILAKYFTPDSNWTWYVLEADREGDDWYFFGLVDGFETELGHFMLSDLRTARGPMGLPIERDLYFDGKVYGDVTTHLLD